MMGAAVNQANSKYPGSAYNHHITPQSLFCFALDRDDADLVKTRG